MEGAELIQLVLYILYAVYGVVGLVLFVLGFVFWGNVGAVSDAATTMLFVGVAMILICNFAMYANYTRNWLMMLVIELVNVGIFVIFTVIFVVAIIFALGWSDPVADAIRREWNSLAKEEATAAFGADGSKALSPGVCFRDEPDCKAYATAWALVQPITEAATADDMESTCNVATNQEGFSTADKRKIFVNATQQNVNENKDAELEGLTTCNFWTGARWQGCDEMETLCSSCWRNCQNKLVKEGKEGSAVACTVAILTCIFCIVAVTVNKWLIESANEDENEDGKDDEEVVNKMYTGTPMIVAMVLNCIVLLVGLVTFILCAVRLGTSDGYASVLTMLLVIGFMILLTGGAIVSEYTRALLILSTSEV